MNHLFELKKQSIPVLLISGIFRADQPFFRSYGSLWRKALRGFEHLFVQNENSKLLLQKIGISEQASISGDTRFDRVVAIASQKKEVDFIEAFIGNRICIVAGSTWEQDEKLLSEWMRSTTNACLIIAPHVVNESKALHIEQLFSQTQRYSLVKSSGIVSPASNVLIINCIGLLSSLYRYGNIAYIGGGFSAGIHNTLEAAVYGIPVVFGPNYKKFDEAKALIQCNGGISVADIYAGVNVLNTLVNDETKRNQMGNNAGDLVKNNTGACDKIIDYIVEKRLLTN
jgi:3-deoxy-D-manno-octulosonic-acid transferase